MVAGTYQPGGSLPSSPRERSRLASESVAAGTGAAAADGVDADGVDADGEADADVAGAGAAAGVPDGGWGDAGRNHDVKLAARAMARTDRCLDIPFSFVRPEVPEGSCVGDGPAQRLPVPDGSRAAPLIR